MDSTYTCIRQSTDFISVNSTAVLYSPSLSKKSHLEFCVISEQITYMIVIVSDWREQQNTELVK